MKKGTRKDFWQPETRWNALQTDISANSACWECLKTESMKQLHQLEHGKRGSIELARDDAAAPGHSGARGRRHAAMHSLAVLIEPPLGVRARNETALGIPASDPVDAIVEKEETQLLRLGTLVQRGREPAATLFEFGLEHVSMEDAAVDQSGGSFFVIFASIAVDEMPATTREELVSTRDGSLPVLLAVDIAVDALTSLEPVDWAADGAQAEEKVGGHGR